jgi:hypothetical protein
VLERLATDGMPDTAAVTEDGCLLVTAHRRADRVVLWDVQTGVRVRDLVCPAPTFLMARGSLLMVAQGETGRIRVFDAAADWKLVSEVAVGRGDVNYLSAAAGSAFDGKVMATCGRAAHQREVYLLDLRTKESKRVAGPLFLDAATLAPDGHQVLLQPAAGQQGQPQVWDLAELVGGRGAAAATGAYRHASWLRPVGRDAWWADNDLLYVGLPPRPVPGLPAGPVAVDATGDACYFIAPQKVSVVSVSGPAAGELVAECPVALPAGSSLSAAGPQGTRLLNAVEVERPEGGVVYRPPLASTVGGRSYLFVYLSEKGGSSGLYRTVLPVPPATPTTRPAPVLFAPLAGPGRVVHMELTEDGTALLTAHESEGVVVAWEVATGRQLAAVSVPAPRHLLCRGDRAYVANFGRGTVSVLSRPDGWKVVDELKVESPDVYFLSAPPGPAFDQRLLVAGGTVVAADPLLGQPAGARYAVHLVDVGRDKAVEVQASTYRTYPMFGHGADAMYSVCPWDALRTGSFPLSAYVSGDDRRHARPARRVDEPPHLEPVGDAGVWAGGHGVWAGDGTETVRESIGLMAVGDQARPVVYGLDNGAIRAFQADAGLAPLGERRAVLPPGLRLYARTAAEAMAWRGSDEKLREWRGFDRLHGGSQAIVSRPLAVTHAGQTYLYVLDPTGGLAYRAATTAFPDVPTPPDAQAAAGNGPTTLPAEAARTAGSTFVPVPAAGRVAAMALTEDGRHLLVADDAGNRLTVWDVAAARVAKQFAFPSPRHVICRGDLAFVVNPSTGVLSVLDRAKDWATVDELPVGEGAYHLSAARGGYFAGLVVVSRTGTAGAEVVAVDVRRRTRDVIVRPPSLGAAHVDYRGQSLLVQGALMNASPRGSLTRLPLEPQAGSPVVAADRAHADYGYLRQAWDLPVWTDGRRLVAGDPPRAYLDADRYDPGVPVMAVPDETRPVVYTVRPTAVTASRLDRSLAELVTTPVDAAELFPKVRRDVPAALGTGGVGDPYRFDTALAATIGGRTHLFAADDLRALRRLELPAAAATTPGAGVVSAAGPAGLPGRTPVVDAGPIVVLPGTGVDLAWGLNGATVLLLDAQALRVLSPDGTAVREEHVLPGVYRKVRERPGYFVALADQSVDLLDRRTLRVLKQILIPVARATDLVLHPVARTAYVAGVNDGSAPDGGEYRLFVVDEGAGLARSVPRAKPGTIGLDPHGRLLHCGPRADAGGGLLVRQPRAGWLIDGVVPWSLVPTFKTLTLDPATGDPAGELKVMSLDRPGVAGLVLRADPGARGRLAGSDVADDQAPRKAYPRLADDGRVRDVSFHPTEPLAAVLITGPNNGFVVELLDRATWQVVRGRCAADGQTLRNTRKVMFSPDGSRLLADTGLPDGRQALLAFPLGAAAGASPAAAAATRPVSPATAPAPGAAYPHDSVATGDLEALSPAVVDRPPRPAKALAPDLLPTTVMVGRGYTGFVVGTKGFVLTTTDALPSAADAVPVYYRNPVSAGPPVRPGGAVPQGATGRASVVRADLTRRLVLLKFDAPSPVPAVRLAPADRAAPGGAVVMFGHSGGSRDQTDFALAAGRVAAVDRVQDGRAVMQLDAALGPAFAGAAVFDDRGAVIGLVIGPSAGAAGVATAVPARDVREFLAGAVDPARRPTPAVAPKPPPAVAPPPSRRKVPPAPPPPPLKPVAAAGLTVRETALHREGGRYAQFLVSPDGRRWAVVGSGPLGKATTVVDGVRGPTFAGGHAGTFSPDGKRFAYVAAGADSADAKTLVVEGRPPVPLPGGCTVEPPILSADGRHVALVCVAIDARSRWVVADGKAGKPFDELLSPVTFGTDGVAAYYGLRGEVAVAVRGTVETPLPAAGRPGFALSAGGRLAHQLYVEGVTSRFVVDGKVHNPYQWEAGARFSPDGSRFAYTVRTADLTPLVILDGVEQRVPAATHEGGMAFSDDGRRFAYLGRDGDAETIVVDGVSRPAKLRVSPGFGIRFSPDGSRVAYFAGDETKGGFLVVDNAVVEASAGVDPASVRFSANGGRVACSRLANDRTVRVVVDGADVDAPAADVIHSTAFSPDGSHFAYLARHVDPADRGRTPGTLGAVRPTDRWFVVLDGRVVEGVRPFIDAPLSFGADGTLRVYTWVAGGEGARPSPAELGRLDVVVVGGAAKPTSRPATAPAGR